MVDFNSSKEELNNYKGSEKKKTLILDGQKYLVKFPDPIRKKGKKLSYINNAFSEYIGSNIFKLCGFDVQKTVLGIYELNGKEKIVCGCLDFTMNGDVLYEFENIALGSVDLKVGTNIDEIYNIMKECRMVNFDDFKSWFWDMFIIDSLIGNTDRHNGNWGIILKHGSDDYVFAPIYDCGSCLNPTIDDTEMAFLSDADIKNYALNSYSCLKENGKKINSVEYIASKKNQDCNDALNRIFKRIDMESIEDFIDKLICMFDLRKDFYKKILRQRYDILKAAYLEE